jgi:tannase/feruloyl esterase
VKILRLLRFPKPASTRQNSSLPEPSFHPAAEAPRYDSDIKTEIWLPASGWNGKFLAVGNGGWAGTIPYHTINVSTDVDMADKSDDHVMYSGDPNLKKFFDRGGKLLMYHGWTDPQVSPLNSVTYYENVLNAVGRDKAANSIALFMMPGMNHCAGGDGPDTFNKVKVLEKWVEEGQKPTRIVASHLKNGVVDKTRPLCPYPDVAKYNGTGSVDDAANFSCAQ